MTDTHELYLLKRQQLFNEIGSHAVGSLATCCDHKPYVRSVSCIFLGGYILFQSDKNMQKCIHIKRNPYVSICFDHIQIQGTCIELEHPLHPTSSEFFQLFSEYYPRAARRYSHIDNERVYQITPYIIETWRYIDGEPYQEKFDMILEQYQFHRYEI